MLGLFKRKTVDMEPIEFEASLEVAAPADRVYALVDWSDPGNAKRELGNLVEPIANSVEKYLLVLNVLPDHRFEMTVSEARRPHAYAFSTEIAPPIGKLLWSTERYAITPQGEGACTVSQTVVAKFNDGLTMREVEQELMVMSSACQRALVKLKLHAEQGAEVIKAIERDEQS